ncbi:MAG: adenosylmethionine decarboxylase, partial [Parashewanella sp.]
MIFEGSEKKIEVIVHSSVGSLRMLEYGFWQQLVVNANAEILSVVSNEQCDAYLLSESSLFVWDDRFLMITCGTTTLVNAVVQFIHKVGEPNIARASYHRKSEYFAHLQSSFFKDDLVSLKQNLIGTAYRIGHLDTHHHYWFITDKSDTTSVKDRRYELQMYHITGFAAAYLRGREHTRAGIRKLLQLDELFTGFELDD